MKQIYDLSLTVITALCGILGLIFSSGAGPVQLVFSAVSAMALICSVLYLSEATRLHSLSVSHEKYPYSFGFCLITQKTAIFSVIVQSVIISVSTYG